MLLKQNFLHIAPKSMLVILCILCITSVSFAQEGWESKVPMPTARGWFSTCAVDNHIYALGGALDIGSNLDAVEAFDPLTNTWTTKTSMPTPRGCAAACAVDGIIYVFGGGWFTVHSTVEAYDPSTDTWTTKSPMPTARSGLSVCVVDGIIYAISGFNDMNNPLSTNTVEAYDPKTDTWTTKAPIPTVRAYFSTSVVNGIIYTFGGFNSRSAPSLGNVEAYDPVSDVWTIKNDMPNPRAGMSSYAFGGNIYFFGGVGSGGGPCYSTIYKYDPVSDNWEEFSNMPYAAFSISNSPLNGKVYFLGGLNTARTPLDVVYEYTPPATSNIEAGDVSGTWTKANSPYYINGEITIPNDSTLRIEAGVEVVFTGHYELNVKGKLLAIGTENDTILFTINDTTGFYGLGDSPEDEGSWGGINLENISNSNDSTIFEYCSFQYGKADNGGAIYCATEKLRISKCLFRNNMCIETHPFGGTGGAIYVLDGKVIIEHCEFCFNKADFIGSALYIVNSDVIIRNNHFHNNISGPIAIRQSDAIFINNLIEQNHSINDGILWVTNEDSENTAIINNTIVYNKCAQGAILAHGGFFVNNIIYGNEPSQVYFNFTRSPGFYNCLIEGGKEGFTGAAFSGYYENCIDADPLFIDEANGDYRLSDSSPCIGAGYYEEGLTPTCDCVGNPRPNPLGSMPDIGAYENELDSPTDIEENESQVPSKFALAQNYPNPFNPSTTIKYSIPTSVISNPQRGERSPNSNNLEISPYGRNDNVNVVLRVYNILGSEIAVLVNENQKPGSYEVEWNAIDQSSGVYFYQLTAGEFVETKKLILLK